jgi:predicted AAA+ superfamily ATPase
VLPHSLPLCEGVTSFSPPLRKGGIKGGCETVPALPIDWTVLPFNLPLIFKGESKGVKKSRWEFPIRDIDKIEIKFYFVPMFLKRDIKSSLLKKLRQYPAASLVGPRQAGKTTLAKSLSNLYYDLEQEEDRLRLDVEWNEAVSQKKLIILDEAQSDPKIFPRLRAYIDAHSKEKGKFLLLSSVSPALMRNVSESLAGRLALCELTPLLISELKNPKNEKKLWLMGGFPRGGILNVEGFPQWQLDYLTLLAQRDLPQWGLSAKPQITLRLFKMLALHQGQIWNASQIGQSLGLNYHTINSYMEYLIHSYLIRLLPPFHANLSKRLVRSPKLYWRDSGLLHALLGIQKNTNLLTQPWVGASWEGWVIEQVLSHLSARGVLFEPFFLRTNRGDEIDLLIQFPKKLWAFEIKLTSSPAMQDLEKLNHIAKDVKVDQCVLISKTTKTIQSKTTLSTNLLECLHLLPT